MINLNPDEEYLNDDVDTAQRRWTTRKQVRVAIAIFALVISSLTLRTTLAANITIGSGSVSEFGQGVQITTACSGSSALTITPIASFSNLHNAGSYYFSSLTVSNIPISCFGYELDLRAYDATSSTPLPLYNSTSSVIPVFNNNGVFVTSASNSVLTLTTNSSTSFTANFITPVALSGSVSRFTIQSGVNTIQVSCSAGGPCSVGDTGPGGGIVYYVSNTPFTETGATCGSNCHYLEFAPAGWLTSPQNDGGLYWSSDTSHYSGASGTALGTGFANTTTMLTSNGSYVADSYSAAYVTRQYAGNDSSAGQWFLPSIDELTLIANSSAKSLGSFVASFYWSSSDSSGNMAQGQHLSYSPGTNGKAANFYVRAVRAF